MRNLRYLPIAAVLALPACFNALPPDAQLPPKEKVPCAISDSMPTQPSQAFAHGVPALQERDPSQTAYQPWTSGHPIAVQNGTVYALDRDNGTLALFDATTMVEKKNLGSPISLAMPDGAAPQPQQIVVAPNGTAYMALRGSGKIAVLQPGAAHATMIDVGVEPTALALTPDATKLLVTIAGDRTLVAFALPAMTVLGWGKVGDAPTAVSVDSKGQVLVVHHDAAPLDFSLAALAGKADGAANGVTKALFPHPLGNIYFDEVAKPTRALAIANDPEFGNANVAHTIVSAGTVEDAKVAALLAIKNADPDTCANAGGGGDNGGGSYGGGGGSAKKTEVFSPRRPVEVAVSSPRQTGGNFTPQDPSQIVAEPAEVAPAGPQRALTAQFDQPSDIQFHPTLRAALVTAAGSDNVMIVAISEAATRQAVGEILLADNKVTGHAPRGIAIGADGKFAYVLNGNSFTVTKIDLSLMNGAGKADQGESKVVLITPAAQVSVAYGLDPLPLAEQRGRRIFTYARNEHVSKSNMFACATCHLEGKEDKQVWFITGGPRQTPALAGRLFDTAPYNWRGTQDVLQNNMTDTVHRMGGLGLETAELEDLEKYLVNSLIAPPNPNRQANGLTPAQKAGKAVYDVQCVGCHVAGSGTDGKDHDVGTAGEDDKAIAVIAGESQIMFNTPTLRGLHYTAPYLHDGSAATLEDVISRADGKMGTVTPEQMPDLVAYLKTL